MMEFRFWLRIVSNLFKGEEFYLNSLVENFRDFEKIIFRLKNLGLNLLKN